MQVPCSRKSARICKGKWLRAFEELIISSDCRVPLMTLKGMRKKNNKVSDGSVATTLGNINEPQGPDEIGETAT